MDFENKVETNIENTENEVKTAEPAKAKAKEKKSFVQWLAGVTTSKSGAGLALRIVIGLLAPYAYLMLCGLVFDYWLKMYNMTTFIFFSYAILQLAGIAFAVLSIIRYVNRNKKKK